MEQFKSAEDALDFAIKGEEQAHEFYTELAAKMEKPGMKAIFAQFAKEELGHKAKLVAIKEGKKLVPSDKRVLDLKIGDYLVDVEPDGELSYQDALILAMKREKVAFRMYTDLAAIAPNDDLRTVFLGLAQEEAKHKLRFEVEYDDEFLREN